MNSQPPLLPLRPPGGDRQAQDNGRARKAWQSVLGQLQMEMPRASFDTWVRDTEAVTLEESTLTVQVRNAHARDWLDSRLKSTVQRLLVGILNQSIQVEFLVGDVKEDDIEQVEEEDEPEVTIEPVGWLDYDKIVQPQKQVVVKGYLRRLAAEIGPKVIWLYIGFHQAAWKVHAGEGGATLHSREILRFSGLSFGAFWRLLGNPTVHSQLSGLVQRMDPPQVRKFRRGRDGRPHRAPVRYRVFMMPRLTHADALTMHARLKKLLNEGQTIRDALMELLAVEDVQGLLTPIQGNGSCLPLNTVMDMAQLEAGSSYTPEIDRLAQELHRKIVGSLGDIHITHYFITRVIDAFHLTPAQAWLITVARDLAYVNWRTGERREVVTFKEGYEEMAGLIGSRRFKTVQAWFHPEWTTQQRGGDVTRFLQKIEIPDEGTYSDLRVGSMPRRFRVLLDEPLVASGSNKAGANGTNMAGADGTGNWTQVEAVADADGGNMVDANGSDLNTYKHPLNTNQKITSTAHPLKGARHNPKAAEAVAPDFWELKRLLEQNDVHPKVQKELLEVGASVQAFVSWVLYVASPQSGNLSDPLGYAISRLREHPLREARGVFRQCAGLPPQELLQLIDSIPSHPYEFPKQVNHPLTHPWRQAMGSSNPLLPIVRVILFGEGAYS